MREEELLHLEHILKERLMYLENLILSKSKSMIEINKQKISQSDITSVRMELNNESIHIEKHYEEIKDIKVSLEKFKSKSYGICQMCQEEISLPRLKAKPHAKYCINCRRIIEQEEKFKKKERV